MKSGRSFELAHESELQPFDCSVQANASKHYASELQKQSELSSLHYEGPSIHQSDVPFVNQNIRHSLKEATSTLNVVQPACLQERENIQQQGDDIYNKENDYEYDENEEIERIKQMLKATQDDIQKMNSVTFEFPGQTVKKEANNSLSFLRPLEQLPHRNLPQDLICPMFSKGFQRHLRDQSQCSRKLHSRNLL